MFFLPKAYPFSDFVFEKDENQHQFGDEGEQEEKMFSQTNAEMLITKINSSLSDRDKVVFMYLLLRESGYKLTHDECAKTLSVSRQTYMKLVKNVKLRAAKLIQDSSI